MALITCPDCGQTVSSEAPSCIKCGRPLLESQHPVSPKQQSSALGTVMVLVPFFGVLLIWGWVGNMNLFQNPAGSLWLVTIGVIVVTASLAAIEAGQLGMGTKLGSNGKKGNGPGAWFFAICLLWLFTFPWYLHERSKYGQKSLVVGGVLVALMFMGSSFALGSMIDAKVAEIQQNADEARRNLEKMQRDLQRDLQQYK